MNDWNRLIAEEEMDRWRRNVIRMHFETKLMAERVVREGRTARIRLIKDLDETKAVIERWNKYSTWCRSSGKEIVKDCENGKLPNLFRSKISIPNSAKVIPFTFTSIISHHSKKWSACNPILSNQLKITRKYQTYGH